jgi:hypothetical protein
MNHQIIGKGSSLTPVEISVIYISDNLTMTEMTTSNYRLGFISHFYQRCV